MRARFAVLSILLISLGCSTGHAEATCPANMSMLPAGSFTSAYKDKHAATVAAFCIDNLEVSVAQYDDCQKGGKCSAVAKGDGCNVGKAKKKNHPMNCVDWSQAEKYCAAQGKRLPTVDEWEWAARGGPAGTLYPWGSEKPKKQVCWAASRSVESEEAGSSTCPVGEPKGDASPQGVRGLVGNVMEWTSTPGFNPKTDRHLAGGSAWSDDAKTVSTYWRTFYGMDEHEKTFGIRCAAAPTGAK